MIVHQQRHLTVPQTTIVQVEQTQSLRVLMATELRQVHQLQQTSPLPHVHHLMQAQSKTPALLPRLVVRLVVTIAHKEQLIQMH